MPLPSQIVLYAGPTQQTATVTAITSEPPLHGANAITIIFASQAKLQ